MSWSRDVDRVFAEMEEEIADKVVRKVTLSSHATLVKATPVLTGRAASGWDVTVGAPSTREPEVGGSFATPKSSIPKRKIGEPVYITNNVHYIGFLDDGSSKKAPAGMTSILVSQLEAQFGARGG